MSIPIFLGAVVDPALHAQENKTTMTILGIAIAVGIVYFAIRQIFGLGSSSSSSGGLQGSSSGFNRNGFRKAAKAAGLAKDEVRFLEEYARLLKVGNPEFLFRNPAKLDAFFRSVFKSIEQYSENEAAAEERKAALFQIREGLNQAQNRIVQVSSTRQLGRNMPLSFLVKGDESYPSTVLAVEAGGIAAEPPKDPYGETIRLKRGTKLTCYFYGKARQGYQFETRVSGWELVGAREVMIIAHSDAVKALPARRHQRKESKVPCTFYRVAVSVERTKGKDRQKARVEKIPYLGTIADISAGGVGIQTSNPLQATDFVKIEFDTGAGVQSAFGKVVRMNRLRTSGGIMHIQFVKITRRSLNAILSFVYGYTE
jgi:c-di-GMP-binding flagellar brake protein YcgR